MAQASAPVGNRAGEPEPPGCFFGGAFYGSSVALEGVLPDGRVTVGDLPALCGELRQDAGAGLRVLLLQDGAEGGIFIRDQKGRQTERRDRCQRVAKRKIAPHGVGDRIGQADGLQSLLPPAGVLRALALPADHREEVPGALPVVGVDGRVKEGQLPGKVQCHAVNIFVQHRRRDQPAVE